MMSRLFPMMVFLFLSLSLQAQKAIRDMNAQELGQKKAAAVAAKAQGEVAVYEAAIKLRTELDAAIKAEDYDKAAVLSEKLKALKLPPPISDKLKELQDALSKAVASEDYAKADALKKEIEALKNGGAPPSSKSAASAAGNNSAPGPGSASPPVQPSSGQASQLSKNDIYGSSVTWLGLDFSLFHFVSGTRLGQESKNLKYIAAWQKEFDAAIPQKKLSAWLSKPLFSNEKHAAEPLYIQNLNRSWIVATNSRTLDADQIQAHVQTYKTSARGLGLVFIPGTFDETSWDMSLYIVWFDLDTRTIVHMQMMNSKGGPGSMGRWLDGMVDATKKYVNGHYKRKL